MVLKFNLKKFILCLAIPLAVGGLSALITKGDMDNYKNIIRPPLSPPSILFPIVWTILYILLGISLYLTVQTDAGADDKLKGYIFFGAGLIFNFLWSPIFFSARLYLLAFFILVLLLVSVILMTVSFYKINKFSGLLQIPYIIWLLFAGYLNIAIYILN